MKLNAAQIRSLSGSAFHALADELWCAVLSATPGACRDAAKARWRWAHEMRSSG